MCGIFGYLDRTGSVIAPELAGAMAASLAHRGPDSAGHMIFQLSAGRVMLGATRLRIQDLSSSGDQPVRNENGAVWVVFNGEIYNFRALRTSLEEAGHVFRSSSDTEVIVHLYEQYGRGFISKLEGMFGLALLDLADGTLMLARDRTGKKPVYYSSAAGKFAFASEIKALLLCPWIRKKVNDPAIAEYLSYGYISAPDTAYSDIQELPAGEVLVLSSGGTPELTRFWRLKDKTIDIGEEEAVRRIREIVDRAVERRLAADVPVGVLLSGGLDSSVVCSAAAAKGKVRTFCAGFDGKDSFDERKHAALVSRLFNTEHTELIIKNSPAEIVLELPGIFDQPFGDSSAVPTLLISREARKHVTVVLTGDGGDECFAGYDRFRAALLAERIPQDGQKLLRVIARLLPRTSSIHGLKSRLERFSAGIGEDVLGRHDGWFSVFSEDELRHMFPENDSVTLLSSRKKQEELLEGNTGKTLLKSLLNLNFNSYLKYDLNTKMDRAGMAASLEARSPLLDTELLEFAFSLPDELKIRNGVSKYILKKAYRGVLPAGIINRKKHGFGSPVSGWFQGELGNLYSGKVLAKESAVAGRLNKEYLESLLKEHKSGKRENGRKLWAVLQLELWLRAL